MITIEQEINQLKSSVLEMWVIVINQLENARLALCTNDMDVAAEIHANEKMIDAFEIKNDGLCETILSTFHPDENITRFVLASLKINYNLERVGDYANSIANLVRKQETYFDTALLKEVHVAEMFETAHIMNVRAYESYAFNDIARVRNLTSSDKKINAWKAESLPSLVNFANTRPADAVQAFQLFSIIGKLERAGDHLSNIAEEITFFLDEKIIKHKKIKNNN
ncbi:MAG: PhoU domain-containing protein [Bacteroidales bacterium]|jgi:phosphate transport system protein|nr:PhoU domain-containing protein [Bacteroidales bacterium]